MKKLKSEDIKKLHKISYIGYNESDINDFIEMANIITNDIEEIKKINTEGVEPSYYPQDIIIRDLRDDDAESCLNKSDILKNAPEKDSDFITIVKVV